MLAFQAVGVATGTDTTRRGECRASCDRSMPITGAGFSSILVEAIANRNPVNRGIVLAAIRCLLKAVVLASVSV